MMTTEDSMQYDESYGAYEEGYDEGAYYQEGGQEAAGGAGSWQQQGRIQCSYCDKAFHKDSLNRHVKNIHGPAQTFQCQYCQKTFKNSDSLQDHQSRVCKYVPVKRQSDYAN